MATLSPASWAELLQLLENTPTELPPALKDAAVAYRDAVASGRLRADRRQALDELSDQAQALDLGY